MCSFIKLRCMTSFFHCHEDVEAMTKYILCYSFPVLKSVSSSVTGEYMCGLLSPWTLAWLSNLHVSPYITFLQLWLQSSCRHKVNESWPYLYLLNVAQTSSRSHPGLDADAWEARACGWLLCYLSILNCIFISVINMIFIVITNIKTYSLTPWHLAMTFSRILQHTRHWS